MFWLSSAIRIFFVSILICVSPINYAINRLALICEFVKTHDFTPPNSDDAYFVFIVSINDAERRVNDLPQMFDMKLRNDTAAQWMRFESLNLGKISAVSFSPTSGAPSPL